uniref:Uncharacterized protein n=1 Tax=Oryza glumipatula TaxID=40148 RepID=A0A0E0A9I4_9ORYZ
MPNGCPRNTMSAPATSLSLTPPLYSSLFPKPKHRKQQHTPHTRVPSPRKHTPRTECPELGHLPRLRRLSRRRRASPDQSVEHVVGTVLAAGHLNRRRRSGRLRALSRPGDVDAGVLPPLANNHHLRHSLYLAASVSLLEEEYVEEEEGEFVDDQVQEFADEGKPKGMGYRVLTPSIQIFRADMPRSVAPPRLWDVLTLNVV